MIYMKTLKIVAVLTLAVVAAALLTASAYAYMGGRIGSPFAANSQTNGGGFGGMMGAGGMMGGYGYNNIPQQSGTPTSPSNHQSGAWGCQRSITGYYAPSGTGASTTEPLNIAAAVTTAQNYLTSTGNPNFALVQVEEYAQNFYVQIKEKDTGIGAFELLINKYTATISPEMGPNMMWNTKYSMMRTGMMSGVFGTPTTSTTITLDQAKSDAQKYLNSNIAGTTVGDATAFYGYYTIEVLNKGIQYGMLSVNGYTEQVWYHTWHGVFVQEWTS
jgi:hypothetical protein